MAFSSISNLAIRVGSAIKKELWDKVKGNFDDLNSRVNTLELLNTKVKVITFDFRNAASFNTATGVYYYEAVDTFTLTNAFLRIYEKGSLTGTLQVDIKKSVTNLDNPSFVTIFTTRPSINFSTASNYVSSTNQVFDPGRVNIVPGNFLRLDITSMPTNGTLSKFMFNLYGES
jgi:hypothetical protein